MTNFAIYLIFIRLGISTEGSEPPTVPRQLFASLISVEEKKTLFRRPVSPSRSSRLLSIRLGLRLLLIQEILRS